MENDCREGKREDASALPRDYSRFKRLHANGRAQIREDATKTLGFISTVELVNDEQD